MKSINYFKYNFIRSVPIIFKSSENVKHSDTFNCLLGYILVYFVRKPLFYNVLWL